MLTTYLFFFFAILAIASALAMVFNKHTVNSALFLVLNLLSLAGIYLLMEAQFLAVVQILVYAGAIMVLFLFVIMLLNLESESKLFSSVAVKEIVVVLLSAAILAQLMYSISDWFNLSGNNPIALGELGTVEAVGDVLYTTYLLPFEVTAILLTAAVVGALVIAQRKTHLEK
jgi:NADH-quinone oxidoreductase subunit J